MYNQWIIPSRWIMEDTNRQIQEWEHKVLAIEEEISSLGRITRSKKRRQEELIEKLENAKQSLATRKEMLERYNNTYLKIRQESEAFGWRYPTWAEWPRDADIFVDQAFNAYMAKMDIMHFGRAYGV